MAQSRNALWEDEGVWSLDDAQTIGDLTQSERESTFPRDRPRVSTDGSGQLSIAHNIGLRGLRFVVTGTGRSGTSYVATVLRRVGLRVGHESWYRIWPGISDQSVFERDPLREGVSRVIEEYRRRRQMLDGDVSWTAVPRLPRFRGTAFLQLRHPLRVIGSFAGYEFFTRPSRRRRFAQAHMASLSGSDDLVDGMRWWLGWNQRAALVADYIYRVEALDEHLLSRILSMVGSFPAEEVLKAALRTIPRNENSLPTMTGRRPLSVSLEDLPDVPEVEQLIAQAKVWGYQLS